MGERVPRGALSLATPAGGNPAAVSATPHISNDRRNVTAYWRGSADATSGDDAGRGQPRRRRLWGDSADFRTIGAGGN